MNIKLLILDVDGVLTNGQLVYGQKGEMLKVFHVHDGLGIKAAQANGIKVAVISAKDSLPLRQRLVDLGVTEHFLGAQDKDAAFQDLIVKLDVAPEHVAYIGDDLVDVKVMRQVGFPVAVKNAQGLVKAASKHRTQLNGGEGAVRETIDYILRQQVGLEKAYKDYL
ncbi:MAG: HAD-IIIA family hydrolase [Natronospirillum sp.]